MYPWAIDQREARVRRMTVHWKQMSTVMSARAIANFANCSRGTLYQSSTTKMRNQHDPEQHHDPGPGVHEAVVVELEPAPVRTERLADGGDLGFGDHAGFSIRRNIWQRVSSNSIETSAASSPVASCRKLSSVR